MYVHEEVIKKINRRLYEINAELYFHSVRSDIIRLPKIKEDDLFVHTEEKHIIIYLCKIDSNPREVELIEKSGLFEDTIIEAILTAHKKEKEDILALRRRKMDVGESNKMYFVLGNKVLYIDKKEYELNILFNQWLWSNERAEGITFDNYKDGK